MKDVLVLYHKPCKVVGEASPSYSSLLCLGCGKFMNVKECKDEIGVWNFPGWWIQNPDPYTYPYSEY